LLSYNDTYNDSYDRLYTILIDNTNDQLESKFHNCKWTILHSMWNVQINNNKKKSCEWSNGVKSICIVFPFVCPKES